MTAPRVTMADIKIRLLDRIRQLVVYLAPKGKFKGAYYFALNPRRHDKHLGSFWIKVAKGKGQGAWMDGATGDRGDIVDLCGYCLSHRNRQETYAWGLGWTGLDGSIDIKTLERRRQDRDRDDAAQEAKDAAELRRKRRGAFAWWLKAPPIRGTIGETYIREGRGLVGLDWSNAAHRLGALRFLPAADHTDVDGVVTTWPAIIAAMCDGAGKVGAVHRTFIMPDGSDKAPVDPPRMIWPKFGGYAIRIGRGAGGLTPEERCRRGEKLPLVLTEGWEDAVANLLSVPEFMHWAAGTQGMMAEIPILPCFSEIILCRDNDWTKDQAVRGFERVRRVLKARIKAAGLEIPVMVAGAFVGKDSNDQYRGA